MTCRITFSKPEDVTNPGMDGVQWSFPFLIVDTTFIGSPEEHQKTSEHRIIVPISRSRLVAWRLSDTDTVKVLFEFGRRFLQSALAQFPPLADYSIRHPMITTASHEGKRPFDPDQIPDPTDHVIEFELLKLPIGF